MDTVSPPVKSPPKRMRHRDEMGIPVTRRNPRIDESMCESICRLVARGLNISESCAKMGIDREQFFTWKSRNQSKYDDILTRLRAARVDSLLAEVESASQGDASRGIRHDWRASQWLLGVTAPERFAKQANAEQQAPPSITISIAPAIAELVYGKQDKPVIDVVAEQPKQIGQGDKASNG